MFFLCCAIASPLTAALDCSDLPVVAGTADLRCWNGDSKKSLAGIWHLSYQSADGTVDFDGMTQLPARWRELQPPLPYLGRGVYRLRLLLPVPMDHLGLQLTRSNMARKVILREPSGRNTVLFDSGYTERGEDTIGPMRMPVIDLPVMPIDSELIIVHNNSQSVHGGVEDEIFIGPIVEMMRRDQLVKNVAVVISTVLAVFFIINIALWLVRGEDWTFFALGSFALALALRQLVVSGVMYDYFPQLSTVVDAVLGWISFLWAFAVGQLYLRGSYPKLIPLWLPVICLVATAVAVLLLFGQPLYVLQAYGDYFRPLVVLTLVSAISFMIYGLKTPTRELKISILSGFVMVFGAGADTIYFHLVEYYSMISLTSISVIVFVGIQTVLMSRRYWLSLQTNAKLSVDLQRLNAQLENKVAERTAQLALKNQELEGLARTDALTGLANRRAIDEKLVEEAARGRRSGQAMALVLVDLDHFKRVNDEYGHDVGDQVLIGTAETLLKGARVEDFPGRWGGEEFCIILPETDSSSASAIGERLRELIEQQSYAVGERQLLITASIGLALLPAGGSIEQAIKNADLALYRAKKSGRNTVCSAWSDNPV